ncbi:MAG: mRNA binding protein puf3 [Pycnora praestabilis]|nr:MAG: mRNA binding protein puf3 [Pycnora praestabilis]
MTSATVGRPAGVTMNGARASRLADFGATSGRNNGDESRSSHGSSLGQSFGAGGTGWNGGIWGSSALGTGFASGSTNGGGPRDDSTYLSTSVKSFEGKSGSGSLVSSSETDAWGHRQGTSPVRHRNSNQNAPPQALQEQSNNTSPYFSLPRQPAIGQGINNKSPNKTFLDPTSGSFVTSRGLDERSVGFAGLQTYNANDENQRQIPSIINKFELDEYENGTTNTTRSFTSNPGFAGPNSGTALRSESLPPSRNRAEYTSQYGLQPPGNTAFSQYPQTSTPLPSYRPAHSGHTSSFSSQTNGRKYEDSAKQTQEAEMTASFGKVNLHGSNDQGAYAQFSGSIAGGLQHATSQMPYEYGYSRHIPSFTSINPWGRDDGTLQRGPESSTPDGIPENTANEPFDPYRGVRFGDRGMNSPGGSEHRRNQHSPFYSTGGTPPSGSDHYRSSSRGGQHSRAQPNGHSALLDRKLRGLQREQQEFLHPHANPLMNQQFRSPFTNPYDYSPHNGMRFSHLGPYYPIQPTTGIPPAPVAPRGPSRDQDVGHNLRSALLEEFRSNSKTNKRYELKASQDIYDHIVEFSGDQHGSRFIQQKLETANSDEKDQVFREIQPNSIQLMTDVFGNYVIQKFFEHGNQSQKKILANQMKGHILTLSLQMYGCRVVQKALEYILTDQQAVLIKELEAHVLKCVKDQNGNHVIQKAIERVPAEHIQFIIKAFTGHVQSLATHPYGCRVIQRMLEHCGEPARSNILNELHACASTLFTDQYGNYVTQHVIEHGAEEDRAKIVKLVTAQLVPFSRHKFASNVVEKSIEFGTEEQRRQILTTMTTLNEKGESLLPSLMRDQYGNYVIQKLLAQLNGADHDQFMEQIQPQLVLLKKFSYGKQITAIEKLLYSSTTPPNPSQATTPPPLATDTNMSAATTPPLLTGDAQSPQSSSLPSTNTSTVDGPVGERANKLQDVGEIGIATTNS